MGRQGAIVLTGGTWRRPACLIKGVATVAAEKTNPTADDPVWIGVARETSPAPWRKDAHRGGVLTPGGGHERNFVEACLCHAAIAIGASEGTSSEAIFALYLHRPVALVNVPDTAGPEATMRTLKTAARRRIKPTEDEDPVRRGMRQAYEWADSFNSRFWHQPLPRTDAEADAIVKEPLRTIGNVEDRLAWPSLANAGDWAAFVEASIIEAGRGQLGPSHSYHLVS
ncbi:SLOG cluster 4 domain-containing protein [Kocuria rosea]|uniref:SLOG cluster 4 domain-containing protein n=1 Tax=Kocuria rosea TaxID=1275 RepID=UPI001364969A